MAQWAKSTRHEFGRRWRVTHLFHETVLPRFSELVWRMTSQKPLRQFKNWAGKNAKISRCWLEPDDDLGSLCVSGCDINPWCVLVVQKLPLRILCWSSCPGMGQIRTSVNEDLFWDLRCTWSCLCGHQKTEEIHREELG